MEIQSYKVGKRYNVEMSRRPKGSVNYSVDLSPEVQAIADIMGANLSTRDLIILVSIDQIITTGPVEFNSGLVCDLLDLKHPMINYYFGSREKWLGFACTPGLGFYFLSSFLRLRATINHHKPRTSRARPSRANTR